eukprot:4615134-Karenia_brevis.AAC.1
MYFRASYRRHCAARLRECCCERWLAEFASKGSHMHKIHLDTESALSQYCEPHHNRDAYASHMGA